MSFFKDCYLKNYHLYDSLMLHQDYQKRILPTLNSIVPFKGKTVADIGCGTGRLARLFIEDAEKIYLCDSSEKMLEGASARFQSFPEHKYEIAISSTFNLPFIENKFDILIEGWSLSFCIKETTLWDKLINELLRVIKKGGTLIIIETLGYGTDVPNCTNNCLNSFYSYLMNERGFKFKWVRTDYEYDDENQAILYSNAFFDREVVENLLIEPKKIIPECTGFWWFNK